MMKQLVLMAALAVSSTAFAADTVINRTGFGSGTPANSFGNVGVENAKIVNHDAGVLHAPQYMPFYPTAGTIWPRVVEVPCKEAIDGSLTCEKYEWSPSMGRAEYLFITPVVKSDAPNIVPVLVPGPERVIIKEVPAKKPRE